MADTNKSPGKTAPNPAPVKATSAKSLALIDQLAGPYNFPAFPSKGDRVNIDDLSDSIGAQLEALQHALYKKAEPAETAFGRTKQDAPARFQLEKDQADADSALKLALANAALEWAQAESDYKNAQSQYRFTIKSAEQAMHVAAKPTSTVAHSSAEVSAGAIGRHKVRELAAADAIQGFVATATGAANALGAAEAALRSAYVGLVGTLYTACSVLQVANANAELTFWQTSHDNDEQIN